jgi:hypothetical protein
MKRASILIVAMLILSGMSACKESGRDSVRAACGAEIEKLCAGEDRIGQCLRKHQDELSDKCRAGLRDKK